MKNTFIAIRKILIVEDEILLKKRLTFFLSQMGAEISSANNLAQAYDFLKKTDFEFALLVVILPDGNGLDLLEQKQFPPQCGVVVMTAEGGVKNAVEAMRKGAKEYLVKPIDFSELPIVFERSKTVLL